MDEGDLSPIFERISLLEDGDRRALARLFGALYDPRDLPTQALCETLRAIGSLDAKSIEWLAAWFQDNVNMWGSIVGRRVVND